MLKSFACLGLLAMIATPPVAWAYDDEMMGTRANGRMERRDEAADRVPDPRMDYKDEKTRRPPPVDARNDAPYAPDMSDPPRLRDTQPPVAPGQ